MLLDLLTWGCEDFLHISVIAVALRLKDCEEL